MIHKTKLLPIILILTLLISAFLIKLFAAGDATPFYIGNAMRYADADDSLSAGYLTSELDNITMEAWVKADTLPEASSCIRIMYNGDSSSTGYGIYLVNNIPCILMGGVAFASSGVPISTSNWYHLAAVRADGVWKLYINGTEYTPENSTAVPKALAGNETFTVGNSSYRENFTGSIDEVRFWKVARTADYIRNNMYVKLDGTETGLLAYYNFDQDGIVPGGDNTAASTVTDVAGGDQNLTISGFNLTGDTSNFVQSVHLGAFQLEGTAYSVGEADGYVAIPIVRTGGSEGSVTINYTTADGTAAAGTNYTATSGSVTFAEGETNKNVQIPVINQSMSDSKAFTFSISGQNGINIGSNSSAEITITPCTVTAPTVTATGKTPTFTQGSLNNADLFSSVAAATNDDGQTFSGAALTVTNVSDTTECLTVDGADIALADSASGTFAGGGSYSVAVSGTTATVTLSGMALDDAAMAALIDGIAYKNNAAHVTAGNRVVTLTSVTDSGSVNNTAAPGITATITVVNYMPADGETLDISACAGGTVIIIGEGRSAILSGNSANLTNVRIICEAGATLTLRNVVINNGSNSNICPLTFTGAGSKLITESGTTSALTGGASAPGISVAASAELFLENNGTLTVNGGSRCAGLQCPDGATLTVSGEGTLNATGVGGAGIGGGYQQKGGTMTFLNGIVTARALILTIKPTAYSGAGIGGGARAACGSITISGGFITAISAYTINMYGYAGIGSADIMITGGEVTAKGWYCGAGIGGASNSGSTITITGGTVVATGGTYSMGIGSGGALSIDSSAPKVTIKGGIVYATGGTLTGAGIGGFRLGSGGEIEISGGTVYAEGGSAFNGYSPRDIGPGAEGADGTLTISGAAKIFLKNNNCTTPTTTTHTNSTYTAGATEVYGAAISVPDTWTAGFGAYLRPCTLSYDANGGSGAPDSVTRLYNAEITLPDGSSLSLANYHFDGWNTEANGSGTSYTAGGSYTIEADTTLYAQWSANIFTVNYAANGGPVAPASQDKLYGSTYGKASDGKTAAAMPTPSRAGHTFTGWFTAASGGTKVADSDTVSITENTTLYAQWVLENSDISDENDYTQEKNITVTETSSSLFSGSESPIKAEANMNNAFTSSVEVRVTDSEQDASAFSLGAGNDVYPFDIALYIKGTNTKTEPKDGYSVTISLPVPEKLLEVKEHLSVVHKSDNGTITTLKSQLKRINGVWYIEFEATEFSPYALVVSSADAFRETAGVPYYLDSDGKEVFIGFAANRKYIAPTGVAVLMKENKKSFTDTETHWAKDYICFVAERELFIGTCKNMFEPDMSMTRAMFVTIIGRLYERSYGEITSAANGAFTDADYNGWYGKYVDWAADNGIITGVGGGLFAPDRKITRQEMAVIIYRFADFLGVPTGNMDTKLTYPDASAISDWAENAALYCQSTGIILGRDSGGFDPQGIATRAEVAAIVKRFVEYVIK